jgi:hypothetical protein
MLEVRLTKSNACKLKCKHKKAAQDLRWKAGRPPRPIAGRPGRPIAGRPGYYPGAAWGAAAVGAAAAGAAYYNNVTTTATASTCAQTNISTNTDQRAEAAIAQCQRRLTHFCLASPSARARQPSAHSPINVRSIPACLSAAPAPGSAITWRVPDQRRRSHAIRIA